MDIQTIRITPKLAQKFLNENTNNRGLRAGIVEKYARDMAEDRWTTCIDPIAFYEDGTLANGQHRLWAIVESGKSQQFIVASGVPAGASLNLDSLAPRSFVDNAKIGGTSISTNVAATVRMVEWGTSRVYPPPTYAQMLVATKRHAEACEFACNRLDGKGMRAAPVTGAVARAWYYENDKDKLARFCHVISNGMADGARESAAVAARNVVIDLMLKGVHTPEAKDELFAKVQHAIWKFMRGHPLALLRKVEDEKYPKLGEA